MRRAVALVAALAALRAFAFADDSRKHDLRPAYRKGEKIAYEGAFRSEQTVRLEVDPGAGAHTTEVANGQKVAFNDEVVEAGADGRPTKLKRTYTQYVFEDREPGATDFTREEGALHGRTLLLEAGEGGRVKATDLSGAAVPEREAKGLTLGDRAELLMPAEPVAEGASWTLSGDKFREAFPGLVGAGAEGRCECKLAQVVREGEKERARIELHLVAAGDSEPGGPRVTFDLKGELRFDLSRRKLASMLLEGLGTTDHVKRDPESGGKLTIAGRGPVRFEKKFTFEGP